MGYPLSFEALEVIAKARREAHEKLERDTPDSHPDSKMGDRTFRALLDLLMVSDPWPGEIPGSQELLVSFADAESRARGYDGWIVAYHEFQRPNDGCRISVIGRGFTPRSVVSADGVSLRTAFIANNILRAWLPKDVPPESVGDVTVDGVAVMFGWE